MNDALLSLNRANDVDPEIRQSYIWDQPNCTSIECSDMLPDWRPQEPKQNGVVIGTVVGFTLCGGALVDYSGNRLGPLVARSLTAADICALNCHVALMFENGDPSRPVLIGPIQSFSPLAETTRPDNHLVAAGSDGERLVISASDEVVLRCGKSSLTLTRGGDVIIRGDYLLSRSSGVNAIKGAVVKLN